MKIIRCDFHTRYQQVAMLDDETGELIERRLDHEKGEGGWSTLSARSQHLTYSLLSIPMGAALFAGFAKGAGLDT